MALDAHIAALETKHGNLEQKLHETRLSPASSDAEIAEIKREKLRVKDQIASLRNTVH